MNKDNIFTEEYIDFLTEREQYLLEGYIKYKQDLPALHIIREASGEIIEEYKQDHEMQMGLREFKKRENYFKRKGVISEKDKFKQQYLIDRNITEKIATDFIAEKEEEKFITYYDKTHKEFIENKKTSSSYETMRILELVKRHIVNFYKEKVFTELELEAERQAELTQALREVYGDLLDEKDNSDFER